MNYAVLSVKPLDNFKLLLTFKSGERKIYDMKPHLNGPLFGSLNDIHLFNKVCVRFDTIEWENGADIDPEVLYREGELLTPTSAHL